MDGPWVKSSYSGPDGGNCLEWVPARSDYEAVRVRDSKAPATHLPFGPVAWETFLATAKRPLPY